MIWLWLLLGFFGGCTYLILGLLISWSLTQDADYEPDHVDRLMAVLMGPAVVLSLILPAALYGLIRWLVPRKGGNKLDVE